MDGAVGVLWLNAAASSGCDTNPTSCDTEGSEKPRQGARSLRGAALLMLRGKTLVLRKNESGPTCEQCGKPLRTKRAGRKRRYCSNRCRSAARRNRGWGTSFVSRGYPNEGATRNEPKSATQSEPSQAEKCDLAFPIDILGGSRRWRGRLDRELLRSIVEQEIGGRIVSAATASSSSRACNPAANDNLAIKRRRAA